MLANDERRRTIEEDVLFEHPAEIFFCFATRVDHRRSGVPT